MGIPRNYFSEQIIKENHSAVFTQNIIAYSYNLSQKNLPTIFSTKHLSLLMGINHKSVKGIIARRECSYQFYQIRKKRGGKREISVPHKELKYIQTWIKKNILDNVEIHKNVHGFVKDRSILSNAIAHKNAPVILNIDLKKFFDSIVEKRVFGLFKYLGYHTNLAVDLAKLCTCPISKNYFDTFTDKDKNLFKIIFDQRIGVLPQGAPTSPSISNLVCQKLDKRFAGFAEKNSLGYSRYADDITFSGNLENLPKLSFINKIITDENLFVNWEKVNSYKKGQLQMVTGLLVDNTIRIPKKFKKEIYRHLFFCEKFTAKPHFAYLAKKEGVVRGFEQDWLEGKIRFVYSIEPEVGIKMFEKFNKIIWWE